MLALPAGIPAGGGRPAATRPLAVSLNHAPGTPRKLSERSASLLDEPSPADTKSNSPSESPGARAAHSIALPTYFPAGALTQLPEALTDFDTFFPQSTEPPPGRIGLRLWLSREGIIDKIDVLDTETPNALTSIALEAFRRMRFRPGEIQGTPVGSQLEVVIEFGGLPSDLPAPATRSPAL